MKINLQELSEEYSSILMPSKVFFLMLFRNSKHYQLRKLGSSVS